MSRFVEEDWSGFRASSAPAPQPVVWQQWVHQEGLLAASDEERVQRWLVWLETHTPTPDLVRSYERHHPD